MASGIVGTRQRSVTEASEIVSTRQRSVTDPWKFAAQPRSPFLKKGTLEKRQRGRSHRESSAKKRILKFQKRFLVLSYNSLQYYENEKSKYPKGNFPVCNIQIVEPVKDDEFGGNCKYFQIGNNEEIMYFGAASLKHRDEWMDAIRHAAQELGNRMLDKYHPGIYNKGKWRCCDNGGREASGCTAVYHFTRSNISSGMKFSPAVSHRKPELTLSVPTSGQHDSDCSPHYFDHDDFEIPSSAPITSQYLGSDDVFENESQSPYCSKPITPHHKWGHWLETSSQISGDSGLGSEVGKIHSMTSLMTQEDAPLNETKKLDQAVKMRSTELQFRTKSDESYSDNKNDLLNNTKAMNEKYSIKLGIFKETSDFKAVSFRSLHELVAATSHEVQLLTTTTSLNKATVCIYKTEGEIMSLTTWRSLVAVKETNKTTILDLDEANSRLSISTDLVCYADFTPDGSTVIVAGNITSTSCSKESQKLKDIKVQALPLSELIPKESHLMCLLLHPDPRQPHAVLIVADELFSSMSTTTTLKSLIVNG